jgi:acid phosphatase family membrane protein YuiD
LAIIVCHDATGVRLETEKQGQLLQELVEAFEALHDKDLPEVKLKRFVGHTPIQVLAGIILGVANALVMYNFVFQ